LRKGNRYVLFFLGGEKGKKTYRLEGEECHREMFDWNGREMKTIVNTK
jgi:hypothetical protein